MNRTPKPRPCPVCREEFTPKRIGLKVTKCCLNPACVLDYAQGIRAKDFDRQTKDLKKRLLDNDKSHWKAKAQKAFNEYIRLRDAKDPCISCKKPYELPGKWNAGHYYTVAARSDLRFNEHNCHKQCEHCNSYKSGNISLYTPNIIEKIGVDAFNAMEEVVTKPWRIDDYKEIHRIYTEKIKELKKLSQPDSV